VRMSFGMAVSSTDFLHENGTGWISIFLEWTHTEGDHT